MYIFTYDNYIGIYSISAHTHIFAFISLNCPCHLVVFFYASTRQANPLFISIKAHKLATNFPQ